MQASLNPGSDRAPGIPELLVSSETQPSPAKDGGVLSQAHGDISINQVDHFSIQNLLGVQQDSAQLRPELR